MRILFLHGYGSQPGGTKPMFLFRRGNDVVNPPLPSEDFEKSVRIAQEAFNKGRPDVVVGSSRGGAVAMNLHYHPAFGQRRCGSYRGQPGAIEKQRAIGRSACHRRGGPQDGGRAGPLGVVPSGEEGPYRTEEVAGDEYRTYRSGVNELVPMPRLRKEMTKGSGISPLSSDLYNVQSRQPSGQCHELIPAPFTVLDVIIPAEWNPGPSVQGPRASPGHGTDRVRITAEVDRVDHALLG